jgi:Arc/MetJ-type ribon-helix-helix transcriptional regulator
MARFMISMPDDMVKKLDRRAREERRTRSEFLREAVRNHLAAPATRKAKESANRVRNGKQTARKRWTKKSLEQYLLEKGLARRGCPGLDSLLGPIKNPPDMKQVLRITKRLTGLSEQIIEGREDRV